MRYAISFLALLSAALVPVAASQTEPPSIYIEHISCDRGPFSMRLPKTLSELMKAGIVKREKIDQIEMWDGYATTRKTLYFSGLSLGIITFSNDPDRYLVSFVKVTGTQWSTITPFFIGETVQSVLAKLGAPAIADPRLKANYGGDTSTISFRHARGKITQVKYTCYTG